MKLTSKQLNQALATRLAQEDNKQTIATVSYLSVQDRKTASQIYVEAFENDNLVSWLADLDANCVDHRQQRMNDLNSYLNDFTNGYHLTGRERNTTVGVMNEDNELVGWMSLSPSADQGGRFKDLVSILRSGPPPMYKMKENYGAHSQKRLHEMDKITKARRECMKPTKKWFYLNTICVSKEYQRGKGYGSTLLRIMTDVADAVDCSIYTETTSKELEGMYRHFGFDTVDTLTLAVPGDDSKDAECKVYLLRRDP